MTMKIEPENPRAHFDTRAYSRAIVPGTLPDQKRKYTSIVYRPDSLLVDSLNTQSQKGD